MTGSPPRYGVDHLQRRGLEVMRLERARGTFPPQHLLVARRPA